MLNTVDRGRCARVLGVVVALTLGCGALWAATATAACPNEQVRSETGSLRLPDCRAYELVSPAYKEAGQLTRLGGDEGHFLVESLGAFAGTEADQFRESQGAAYDLIRGALGWRPLALDPSAALFPAVTFLDASGDYGASLWELTEAEGASWALYRREADGTFVEVGPETPPTPAAEQPVQYRGASRDLAHAYLLVKDASDWPGDTTIGSTGDSLYEYSGTGNSEPKLVAVENEGPLASNREARLLGQCGSDLGGLGAGTRYNAVSAAGGTAYFTVARGGCTATHGGKVLTGTGPPVNEVYARLNGAATVTISEPSKAACEACNTSTGLASARYEGASEDGSKAFFSTAQSLLPGTAGRNLYEYDSDSPTGTAHPDGRIVLASAGDTTVSHPTANVQGVVRVSEDGSHVYFVATGVLTHTPNSVGASAQEGADNLYLFERDAAFPEGRTAFIGIVAPSHAECEEDEVAGLEEVCFSDEKLWGGEESPAAITPDGRYLVFVTSVDLTADDTSRVGQLFRYDALTGGLARISVPNSPGESEDGNTSLESDVPSIASPGFGHQMPARRGAESLTMSANGAYVFFQSAKRLTPTAVEGDVNVYEYHEGRVSLITDGHDGSTYREEPVVGLLGTDESGSDVFFKTADPLVGQDTDTNADVYDARIGGGFPAPAPGVECHEEGCQGPLSTPPSFALAATASNAGGDNLAPPPAPPAAPPPSRSVRLAAALRSCHAKRGRRARAACEAAATKRYGASARHATRAAGRR